MTRNRSDFPWVTGLVYHGTRISVEIPWFSTALPFSTQPWNEDLFQSTKYKYTLRALPLLFSFMLLLPRSHCP